MGYKHSFAPLGAPVKGFPHYLVFDDGTVYSFRKGDLLKPIKHKNGYLCVDLFDNGTRKRETIHRLVAEAFVPNPENLPQVNHKDENKENNKASNLEWCTAKYNMNYGLAAKTRHMKIDYTKPTYKINARNASMLTRRPVEQLSDGVVIAEYESAKEAQRQTGIHNGHIGECCKGKRYKTVGGYAWRFKKEE